MENYRKRIVGNEGLIWIKMIVGIVLDERNHTVLIMSRKLKI